MLAAILALLYVAAWFYSRHLPERWSPGAYDLIGNSHQIMHALVRAPPRLPPTPPHSSLFIRAHIHLTRVMHSCCPPGSNFSAIALGGVTVGSPGAAADFGTPLLHPPESILRPSRKVRH